MEEQPKATLYELVQIIQENMVGKIGIVGVTANPPDQIVLYVLKGHLEVATSGAPKELLGYKISFQEVTPRELVELSSKDKMLNGDTDVMVDAMKSIGMPEHLARVYTTMSIKLGELIVGKHRYDYDQRRRVAAEVLAASRQMNGADLDKRIDPNADLAPVIEEEYANIDEDELDELDNVANASERAFRYTIWSLQHVSQWQEKTREIMQEALASMPAPAPPSKKSIYKEMIDEIET